MAQIEDLSTRDFKSDGARDHHWSLPWLALMYPWLSWHQCQLILPGQTLRKGGQSLSSISLPTSTQAPPQALSNWPWLTCSLQGHLHGIGNLLLLSHAAQVGEACATKLLLVDRHLQ